MQRGMCDFANTDSSKWEIKKSRVEEKEVIAFDY